MLIKGFSTKRTMKQRIVLLLSHSGDYYTIDRVEKAVAEKGFQPFRFNTDQFPINIRLNIGFNPGETFLAFNDGTREQFIQKEDIHSVWVRKIGGPRIDGDMEPVIKNGCVRESTETLDIFLNELNNENIGWMDRRPLIERANNKFFQLKHARAVGIRTPETLITNSPGQVKDFYRRMKGGIVTKMLTPLTVSMEGNTPFVYTSRVRENDLDALDSLRFSPMIFQEFIPNSHELRIAYVDGQLFTGTIRQLESTTDKNTADWRSTESGKAQWEPYTVKEDFAVKLRAFMSNIGLRFGAIDVIVQPDGQYVFLEVNPNGEWGQLEKFAGLPISNAIADALVREKK